MEAAAERDFGFACGATKEHVRSGPETEERQRAKPKAPQSFGLRQKQAGDFVARPSQIAADRLGPRASSSARF